MQRHAIAVPEVPALAKQQIISLEPDSVSELLVWGRSNDGSSTMEEENAPKRCPACQRVPLILLNLAGGAIEHARVGCLCRSVALEHPSTEKSWTVAAMN